MEPKKLPDKITHRFKNVVIQEDNTGWNKLISCVEQVNKNEFVAIDVGLFETHSEKVVKRGVMNELGIERPQRSFIALTFDMNQKKLKDIVSKSMSKWLMSNGKALDSLDKAGKFLQKEIKQLMYSDYWLKRKPNKPYTVDKKGFNQPLIETGELASSIDRRKTMGKQGKK